MSRRQPWDYFPLFNVYAFTNAKKARKFVKRITGTRFESSGKSGTFNFYRNTECGQSFGVILLQADNESTAQRYSLLAHECVHYARTFAEEQGMPLDEETEAHVVQCAMLACIDQIGEEWFAIPQTSKSSEE